ncbi:sister chromatid cohesion protein PDS5 homolog D [Impatiens glandulifera]|uniref:sister chromatid cohesion protein PDS5 homolog D n=1 Tax=Impatiens glandulifera TaxID=253017 RepID=UPI001FB179DF|nr:sister chromatid cohesion protein PDS5 homolog D [Impatiens glandulifera]
MAIASSENCSADLIGAAIAGSFGFIVTVYNMKTYKRRKRQGKKKVLESHQDAHNQNLVGVRVKIWWPQDAEYYEGVIDSFDSVTKNHTVLYNDGDMETLTLGDEKWEIVKDDDSEEEHVVKKKACC